MRIRTVKPSFWKSETIASLPKEHRLLAIALLNYADDEGYFLANPALIRGECFPFDEDSKSILGGLQELSKIGYIALGTTSDGQKVGRLPNFLEHQRIDKASPSKIKTKTIDWNNSASPPRIIQEPSTPEVEVEVEVEVEGKGKEHTAAPQPPAGFVAFWNSYPSSRRQGKGKCIKLWIKQRLEAKAAAIVLHVEAMKLTPAWRKDGGQFIPNTLTYLGQGRFDDGTPQAEHRPGIN